MKLRIFKQYVGDGTRYFSPTLGEEREYTRMYGDTSLIDVQCCEPEFVAEIETKAGISAKELAMGGVQVSRTVTAYQLGHQCNDCEMDWLLGHDCYVDAIRTKKWFKFSKKVKINPAVANA